MADPNATIASRPRRRLHRVRRRPDHAGDRDDALVLTERPGVDKPIHNGVDCWSGAFNPIFDTSTAVYHDNQRHNC